MAFRAVESAERYIESGYAEVMPRFNEWLELPRANPDDMAAVLADIQGLLPSFDYHQFKLAEARYPMWLDRRHEKLTVAGAAKFFDLSLNSGDCAELAMKAFLLIRLKYPELVDKMLVAKGHDPFFLRQDVSGSKHFFVLIKSDGWWVVDPSLGVVGKLEDLGYIYNETVSTNRLPSDFRVEPLNGCASFARTHQGDMTYLGWGYKERTAVVTADELQVGIQPSGGDIVFAPIADLPTLDSLDPPIQEALDRFYRKMKVRFPC